MARAPWGQMGGAATQAMPLCIFQERQQSRCPRAAAPLRAGDPSKVYRLLPDRPLVHRFINTVTFVASATTSRDPSAEGAVS